MGGGPTRGPHPATRLRRGCTWPWAQCCCFPSFPGSCATASHFPPGSGSITPQSLGPIFPALVHWRFLVAVFPGNWARHGAQTNLGFSGRPPLGGPWTFLSFDCSDCRIIPTVALSSGGPSSAPSSGGSCLLGSSRLLSQASPRQRVLWDGREPFSRPRKELQHAHSCVLQETIWLTEICAFTFFPPWLKF